MDPTEFDEFNNVIEQAGQRRTDFTLSFTEDDPSSDDIHLVWTTVKVVFEPTGKSKFYNGGDGSVWMADFDADLRSGFYSLDAQGQGV